MEENVSKLVESLDKIEIETLLDIYYTREGFDLVDEKVLDLASKNLVSTRVTGGKNLVSLTDEGLSVCGSVMFQRINERKEIFREKVSDLPKRGVSCIINRIMFRNPMAKESGSINPIDDSYSIDETLWFERVLLKDKRIAVLLDTLYGVLEDVGLSKNINGVRWCTPEVESFLKSEFANTMDLSWMQEDSLKYYYFFYVFAQDQKNLINFKGSGEEYKSMFLGESAAPVDYWLSSNRSDPKNFIFNLGLSEPRVIEFLNQMQEKGFVSERYYPLSSFSFFSDEDTIFMIQDIKKYIEFCQSKFLVPVVDSLLS
jgi:hypothetical protein